LRKLREIRIYPVKSLAGVAVDAAEVEPWGLRHDRRWLLLDPDGTVLTARRHHAMLALEAIPHGDGTIVLRGANGSTLRVPPPRDGQMLPTSLSRLESVRVAGADADEWLSSRLGRPVRLGWLDDPRRRTVSAAHGGRTGDVLNLADAGPLLLTTQASLLQLDEWAFADAAARGEPASPPLAMTRFRPNVVVEGSDIPFAEDEWETIRIGTVDFRLLEHCDRCVLTTIDPDTRRPGKEPLRTLARHRRRDRKVWLGIRIVPTSTGQIHTGDAITVAQATTSR
jgi:MOSC domain-containing protein